MAVIYVIKNEKNGKMYVGATTTSIKKRWRYHCNDINDKRCRERKLYSALREYGKENFSIKEIETVSNDKRFEREKFWIEKLGTYENGYNETIGGVGKGFLNKQLSKRIVDAYRDKGSIKDACEEVGYTSFIVRKALVENGERIKESGEIESERVGIPVDMLSMDGEFQMSFRSISAAAHYLVDSGYNNGNYCSAAQHIRDVCNGEKRNGVVRRSVANHKWRFSRENAELAQ